MPSHYALGWMPKADASTVETWSALADANALNMLAPHVGATVVDITRRLAGAHPRTARLNGRTGRRHSRLAAAAAALLEAAAGDPCHGAGAATHGGRGRGQCQGRRHERVRNAGARGVRAAALAHGLDGPNSTPPPSPRRSRPRHGAGRRRGRPLLLVSRRTWTPFQRLPPRPRSTRGGGPCGSASCRRSSRRS